MNLCFYTVCFVYFVNIFCSNGSHFRAETVFVWSFPQGINALTGSIPEEITTLPLNYMNLGKLKQTSVMIVAGRCLMSSLLYKCSNF